MFISVFDIFKVGIGPSSSHTMGPMTAASLFLAALKKEGQGQVAHIQVSLHGSLSFTGKGHATDRAVILGLMGYTPKTLEPVRIDELIQDSVASKKISPTGFSDITFDCKKDLIFDQGPPLPGHANGIKFFAYDSQGRLLMAKTYYSIGGGSVLEESELQPKGENGMNGFPPTLQSVPFPFSTAGEMLELGSEHDLSIAEMKRANELSYIDEKELDDQLDNLWQVMEECLKQGLEKEGILPGGIGVRRRAGILYRNLKFTEVKQQRPPHYITDYLAVYAMAVNEENSSGGRIVTAPTNGAAGVVPSVIRCYLDFYRGAGVKDIRDFLLVAAAIGGIIKHNSSISGAEVGCQGEVGAASAMAAAGFCAVLGGTNEQIENSAEIALEHHLGLTCDPVGGLVQVPCIERNGFGAVKAVTAASLALAGDGKHFVPLDSCIKTMYDTGLDMNEKYKETSKGGLAVNVVEC